MQIQVFSDFLQPISLEVVVCLILQCDYKLCE